jgi:hypothetical protein
LDTLVLAEMPLLKNGIRIGWIRAVGAQAQGTKALFRVFSPAGEQDPGAEVIGGIVGRAAKAAEKRLKAGGTPGLIHCLGSPRPKAEWDRALAWRGRVCERGEFRREGILIGTLPQPPQAAKGWCEVG